ncbi:MAG: hypothetical protein E7278_02475 [Lachnospiraceae bacterium]|nr:hypothetical protein [Lachnospiraceae bacterium]
MKPSQRLRTQPWNLLFLVLCCAIFASFVFLARYALPKTDDFANMMYGFNRLNITGNIYKSCWQLTREMYMQQQGTFTSSFFATFLLVKCGTNLIRFRRIIMIFVVLLFLAYLLLLHSIAKHFHFHQIWGVFLFCVLWVAVDFAGPGEALLYLSGACVYAFPLTLGFLATVCYLKLMESKHMLPIILYTLVSAGLAFFSAGGVLMVAAMINIFMVWILLYNSYRSRKFLLRGIIPFLGAFGGALLNALAPGNFVRYTASIGDAKPDYLRSIVNTFIITGKHLLHLMLHTYFPVALVLISLFVLFLKNEGTTEQFRLHPLVVLIANYITCYLTVFPTVMGYHLAPGDSAQERMLFAFGWIASVVLMFTWVYFLLWLKVRGYYTLSLHPGNAGIAAVLLVIITIANSFSIPHFRRDGSAPTLTTMYKEYTSGSLDNYYAAYHLALLQADALDVNGQLFIFYEFPETKLFMESSMSAHTDWWVNQTAAAVYQLSLWDYCPDHAFTEEDALQSGYTIQQLLP